MNLAKFHYGQYSYEYKLLRENRKTLSLTVKPDMSILLKAPFEATDQRIEAFFKRKWIWLEKQLRFFKKYQRKTYVKEFLSGESFLYLGRQYNLKIIKGNKDDVSLKKGKLNLITSKSVSNKIHNQFILKNWYKNREKIIFNRRYKIVLKKFKYTFVPQLVTRKMSKRWGSFLSTQKIILNPELIKAPTNCIDYVLTHELCHMKYKKHNKYFFDYLEKMYPDWKLVKEQLELKLG